MSTLSASIRILAFDDQDQTNNPKLRPVDWNRNTLNGIQVNNPGNSKYEIPALATRTIFDGTIALAYDATTQFKVALSTLSPSRYRLSWIGGKDPVFRTARSLGLAGGSVTFIVKANQTVTVTHSAGSVFTGVQVGDDVFIPGVSTGDTALFSTLNEGRWVVLAASGSQLTIVRETGTVFEGFTQTVAITANSQLLVFSSDGVQLDDMISFVSGFASSLLHNYSIVTVTSKFIEFESSAPLPDQTVIPGVGSVAVYNNAKRFYYIETDQEVDVSINGNFVETIVPILAGDSAFPGVKAGTSILYSLAIANNSTQQANVRIITAE
jgi:hypothetical protein